MDATTQSKVLSLFDEGMLPQQIVDELGISMLDVVAALKVRLRIDESEVAEAANDEIRKQRAVDSISARLSLVDGSAPAVARPAPVAEIDRPAPTVDARSVGSAAIGDLSAPALVDLVGASLARLEPGLTPIEGDRPAGGSGSESSRIYARDGSGALVLIEVAASAPTPDLLVRLLAAMGTLQKDATHQVRAILVANQFSDELRHAARAVPALQLRTCHVTLSFAEG